MLRILSVIISSALLLTACSPSSSNLDNQNNPVDMGTAPTSFPVNLAGYVPGISSGNGYYSVAVSPGGAYTFSVPSSVVVDFYVYNKPFNDPSSIELCHWFGYLYANHATDGSYVDPTSPYTCSIDAQQTSSLDNNTVYILISNWDTGTLSFNFDIT